jgi:3-hydroxyisobutyrate dehydrogenase
MAEIQTIAVLGAGGTMGSAMARNLARAGFRVRGWDRSRERAEPLAEDGAEVLDSPAEAAAGADAVLTMVADADAVIESITGALEGKPAAHAIWLQMSTIGERGTDRCIELARERDLTLVDTPVLGTKEPAQKGELVVLASGPPEVRDRLAPVFDVLGKRTMWVGEVGAGTRLKLATNSWLLAVVEGAAETLALAEGLGLDPRLVLEALQGGPLDLPYLQLKGKAMIERSFEPSFKLVLAAKDASLVEQAARSHRLELPLMHAIHERFAQGAQEHPDEDLSAIFLTYAEARAAA